MNSKLEQDLFNFLQRYHDKARPIILGLSGGPDSLCLLLLLRKYKEMYPLQFGIAHVNHNWRQESNQEAEQLQNLAAKWQIPFHLKTLNPTEMKGNLEAICREERLKFFRQLCHTHQYQAVLLGHHADDQAETVLKRILEGASLPQIAGLHPVRIIDGLVCWRPLLEISKAEILHYLEKQDLLPFNDATNLDPRFLRGRLRTQILPQLSLLFGKEVSHGLCHLAKETRELNEYLSLILEAHIKKIKKGPFGYLLDLSAEALPPPFAIKYLLREICQRGECPCSRDLLESASRCLQAGQGNRRFLMGNGVLHIDRRRVFLVLHALSLLPKAQLIKQGHSSYGAWDIEVLPWVNSEKLLSDGGWQAVWDGQVEAFLPLGEYYLGPPSLKAAYPGLHAPISKWWTNAKVPAFMRNQVPVIWNKEGNICQEFLTNRIKKEQCEGWKIILKPHVPAL